VGKNMLSHAINCLSNQRSSFMTKLNMKRFFRHHKSQFRKRLCVGTHYPHTLKILHVVCNVALCVEFLLFRSGALPCEKICRYPEQSGL
jgi:hypothetical protein